MLLQAKNGAVSLILHARRIKGRCRNIFDVVRHRIARIRKAMSVNPRGNVPAYNAGFDAAGRDLYFVHLLKSENSHRPGTDDHKSWANGYADRLRQESPDHAAA